MTTGPTIRQPTAAELDHLPALEIESYQSYADIGMSDVAAWNEPDLGALQEAHAAGLVLIAVDGDEIAGSIECHVLDDTLYVAGVNITPRCAGRRIGAGLLDAAAELAASRDIRRLSLTTFRDVPWNAPYYERLGWRSLPDEETPAGLRAVRARQRDAGYERWPRLTMVKDLPA